MEAFVQAGVVFCQLQAGNSIRRAPELIRRDGLERARKILNALVRNKRDPPAEIYYQLADCDAREGRKQASCRSLGIASTRILDQLPVLHSKAQIQLSAGRYDDALDSAGHYLEQQPDGGESRKI